ncbi:MAG: HDOD domain-containing protein, partial [Deltaproteobacteria bacterium]|nr:HDOD domain-containing protein [Deltaproteobacteria bacterium]
NLSRYHVKFLAEKVETHDEFQKAVDMGFEYFQGYFFSKPQVLKSRDISPSKINMIQIMAEVNKEDFGFRELEKLISRDVSVSYKLMRYINSAYYRRIQEISSIHQAIVMLGERGIRHFISLIVMAKLASDKPTELLRTSIIRARFCELLGKDGNAELDVSELFTLGLFSRYRPRSSRRSSPGRAGSPITWSWWQVMRPGTGKRSPGSCRESG